MCILILKPFKKRICSYLSLFKLNICWFGYSLWFGRVNEIFRDFKLYLTLSFLYCIDQMILYDNNIQMNKQFNLNGYLKNWEFKTFESEYLAFRLINDINNYLKYL